MEIGDVEHNVNISNIFDKNAKELVLNKIQKKDFVNIFDPLCKVINDTLFIDYTYFKYLANESTYNLMNNIIRVQIDSVLLKYPTFMAHVNMQLLSISDINKHKDFIKQICQQLSDLYPDKLNKVYIHNAVYVFSKAFSLIKHFLDKKTQDKIIVVENK